MPTLVAALCALSVSVASAHPGPLFRVVTGGRWGYIDRAGRLVVPPRFERAEPFSEGLAAVVEGGKHAYVDATGAVALAPAHAPAGTVHRPFSNGLAAVRSGDRYGFMDRQGRLVIPARFLSVQDFSEGLALACDERGCGYVDRSGRGVIGPGFMAGEPMRGGLACAVLTMAMSRQRVALYAASGARVSGEYEGCGSLSEGLVAVRVAGRWGWVDARGEGVIAPRFLWAGDFAGGLAPARDDSGLCGYVGRDGQFVLPPRYRSCARFVQGLARVDLAREEGDPDRPAFVDAKGRVVVAGADARPPFDAALDFADGLAAVGSGGEPFLAGTGPLLGYVDGAGRWVWTPRD